jgi:hypothetical protein
VVGRRSFAFRIGSSTAVDRYGYGIAAETPPRRKPQKISTCDVARARD